MGFSAGVMLYVSFMEILVKSERALAAVHGARAGAWITLASFFGGVLLAAGIDALVPQARNPHEARSSDDLSPLKPSGPPVAAFNPSTAVLMRTGLVSALVIGLHNFPEGLATFLAALQDPNLGIALAIAIALHNIPEGVSVAVPIYYATGSRRRAFTYSILSGLAEPVGALVGYGLLRMFFTDDIVGTLFGAVAGIMVYVSLDELLPAARMYGNEHDALFGIVSGMALMAVSLVLMR